jgi:hypothetical protein
MNKFIEAVKRMDLETVKNSLKQDPGWVNWTEKNGKNAIHFLCQVNLHGNKKLEDSSLLILKWLLRQGMNVNSIHQIPDRCGFFPATPLWYAYTKGRNEKIYRWLLANGADPDHCMFAIAWYDDTKAAALFKKYGANIDDDSGGDTPFLAAFLWKRFRVTKWFLEKGANPNASDSKGNSAIYYAVKRKYDLDKVDMLLKHGANPDQKNKEEISARNLADSARMKKLMNLFEDYKAS